MKNDPLTEFIAMRQSLLAKKTALQTRLSLMESASSSGECRSDGANVKAAARGVVAPRTRTQNKISPRDTASKLLGKQEIRSGVARLAYKFTCTNPVNSLSAIFHTKEFKNVGGKFTSAAR
jgi:hypothetical protein